MNSSTLRRKIAILLLGVSLLATAASAADLRRPVHLRAFGLPAGLTSLLDFLWEKAGASLAPDGRPKEGASLDPDGRPREAGGMLDPNGVCSQSDCGGTPSQ